MPDGLQFTAVVGTAIGQPSGVRGRGPALAEHKGGITSLRMLGQRAREPSLLQVGQAVVLGRPQASRSDGSA
jgi:hypothetical protein